MRFLLAVALLWLAAPGPLMADTGYIERIVEEQCNALRDAGDNGVARYRDWFAAVKRDAVAEYEEAAKPVLKLSEAWLDITGELTRRRQQMEALRRHELAIRGFARGPLERSGGPFARDRRSREKHRGLGARIRHPGGAGGYIA